MSRYLLKIQREMHTKDEVGYGTILETSFTPEDVDELLEEIRAIVCAPPADFVPGFRISVGDRIEDLGLVTRRIDSQTTKSGKSFILVEIDGDRMWAIQADVEYKVRR